MKITILACSIAEIVTALALEIIPELWPLFHYIIISICSENYCRYKYRARHLSTIKHLMTVQSYSQSPWNFGVRQPPCLLILGNNEISLIYRWLRLPLMLIISSTGQDELEHAQMHLLTRGVAGISVHWFLQYMMQMLQPVIRKSKWCERNWRTHKNNILYGWLLLGNRIGWSGRDNSLWANQDHKKLLCRDLTSTDLILKVQEINVIYFR